MAYRSNGYFYNWVARKHLVRPHSRTVPTVPYGYEPQIRCYESVASKTKMNTQAYNIIILDKTQIIRRDLVTHNS